MSTARTPQIGPLPLLKPVRKLHAIEELLETTVSGEERKLSEDARDGLAIILREIREQLEEVGCDQ
ncbi:MAG: hypothetical protein AAGE01_15435 [Pseudomonadota bacterium]